MGKRVYLSSFEIVLGVDQFFSPLFYLLVATNSVFL